MKLGTGTPAVITGGASGLGAATARALAAQGVKVALLDIQDEAGEALAAQIGGVYAHCDVTDEASVDAAFATARAAHGQERLHLAAAGVGTHGPTLAFDKETRRLKRRDMAEFKRVTDINLHGVYLTCATSAEGMAAAEPLDADGARGAIVTVSSVAGSDGPMGLIAYAASKSAVIGMSRSMARDLGHVGIRVNCVQPAFFETPMVMSEIEGMARAFSDAYYAHPRRLGRPEEFAGAVVELFRNDFINGETLRLDAASGIMGRMAGR